MLTRLRRLGDLFHRPPDDPPPPRKILFIKLVELGANVQAHAALRRAAELVGRENVYLWVFEDSRAILELLDVVPPENLLTIRSKGIFRFAADSLRTLWTIRRLKIDAVIDMEFFARASAILAFLGNGRRVGLHRFNSSGPYRGDLMTHRVQHNPYIHVSRYFWLLVEALRTARQRPIPRRNYPQEPLETYRFLPAEAELLRLQGRLDQVAGFRVQRPIVLLNPNASNIVPLRKWPADRFLGVAQGAVGRPSGADVGRDRLPRGAAGGGGLRTRDRFIPGREHGGENDASRADRPVLPGGRAGNERQRTPDSLRR